MNLWHSVTHYNPDFQPYGWEHGSSIVFSLFSGFWIIYLAKKKSAGIQELIFRGLCLFITSTIAFWAIVEVLYGRFELSKDIPFVFCNMMGSLLPFYAFYRKKSFFNVMYYLIVVGAVQAIITPSLKFSFPHYEAIKFWSVHSGLLTVIFYSILVFNYRPSLKGVWLTWIFAQVYLVLIVFINYIFDWNYLYINEKPGVHTILNYLGDWPYYVIFMDLILIPYFLLAYLPFKKWRNSAA